MKRQRGQSGFSVIELVIVIVVVAALAAVGYLVYNRQSKTVGPSTSQDSESPTATDVATAPPINSVSDLDKALVILNQTDPGSSDNADTSQLNSQLANF